MLNAMHRTRQAAKTVGNVGLSLTRSHEPANVELEQWSILLEQWYIG